MVRQPLMGPDLRDDASLRLWRPSPTSDGMHQRGSVAPLWYPATMACCLLGCGHVQRRRSQRSTWRRPHGRRLVRRLGSSQESCRSRVMASIGDPQRAPRRGCHLLSPGTACDQGLRRYPCDRATSFAGPNSASSEPSHSWRQERRKNPLSTRGGAQLSSRLADESVIDTLETFLDLAGEVKATAEALHLHRGTMYYRLEKAQRLAGIDIHNGQDRLAVHLGLKLARLLGLRSSGGVVSKSNSAAPAHQALLGTSSPARSNRSHRETETRSRDFESTPRGPKAHRWRLRFVKGWLEAE